MERKFYFFRHGQTDWNRQRLCQGHTDIPLNQKGIEQAQQMRQLFYKQHKLDIIYSSDLQRAYQTAELVAEVSQANIIVRPELRETHLGDLEGMNVDEAKKLVGEEIWLSFRRRDEASLDISFPRGETRREVLERFQRVLAEILKQTDYQNIGLSTHGGAMRNFLHSFLKEHSPVLEIPNCVVYCLIYRPGADREWEVTGPLAQE